jgi:aquaporin Z
MKKLLVEFIGTFVLVFAVGNSLISHQPMAALAMGAALMIATYAGGPVSGAHYNPAVSLSVWRRGGLKTSELVPYVSAQFAGAILAALLVTVVQGPAAEEFAKAAVAEGTKPGASKAPTLFSVFLAELIWSTVLAYVYLHVFTAKKSAGNTYYGLAIGFTAVAGGIALGSVSGGVFNPALFFALCILDIKTWFAIVVYWGAQFLGGFSAAEIFKRTTPDES